MHPDKPYRHRKIGNRALTPETLMMSYGYDPALSEGAVKLPLFQTSTFVFKTAEDGKAFFEMAHGVRQPSATEEPGLIYSRINNPNLQVLEERLTLWDGAESGLAFSSGMAAISTTLLTYLKPGDTFVHSEPVYGGTEHLIDSVLPAFGITGEPFGVFPGSQTLEQAVAQARARGRLGMIFIETPANPTNDLIDIAACARLAREMGPDGSRPLVVVDNTFLGPLWQHPLECGADLVIYSLTKYVGGHSDLVAGGCVGPEPVIAPVRGMRTVLGTMADPHTAWLLVRSMETLKLRMTSAMKNARYVAEFLRDHPKVEQVHYLGFLEPGTEQGRIFATQCKGAGSTFSFDIKGGEAGAYELLNNLHLARLAVSLGGTETLIQHPATMTHSDVPVERLNEMGVTPAMIRISVGIEHPDDVIADLEQALEHVCVGVEAK
jgi:methionine-gamma-lyase